MPLIEAVHDSLPYIDAEPSQTERDAANRLIASEISSGYAKKIHPDMPALPEVNFSELMQQEIDRKANDQPLRGGIDSSRYEAPDEPATDADIDEWRTVLRAAYTSSSYLAGRHNNLALLDEFGKNAWLISNSQLEDVLKSLETELQELKEQTENINRERKMVQESSRGELLGLEEAWKRGIDKIIEVQVATDAVRQETLERRRSQAH